MAFEMLVGLNVVNDSSYDSYRQEMTPILESFGGGFGYDFIVSRVLRSKTNAPINRLFTIFFPSEVAMQALFSNEDYLRVRARHFEYAVTDTTILATYEQQV